MSDRPPGVTVRPARPGEGRAAFALFETALLSIDEPTVRERVGSGELLVATAGAGGRLVGALAHADGEVLAVAVRRRRRGRGVGTALVAAAAERVEGPLTAAFDGRVRPFYESLGFAVEPVREDRYRGRLPADAGPSNGA